MRIMITMMMLEPDTVMTIYQRFNQLECLLWWAMAVGIWRAVKRTTSRQRNVMLVASGVLVIFGVSDYYEAQCRGAVPPWLWVMKIGCAVALLACRFHFIGWENFTLQDRTMKLGLACLAACILVMLMQWWV
jgi:hypothetical protein